MRGMTQWSFVLIQVAATIPLYLTLIAGIGVCIRQRYQRPYVSMMLGCALLAELLWRSIGQAVYRVALQSMGIGSSYRMADVGEIGWLVQIILTRLPVSLLSAIIWGVVLWAVLMIDDRRISRTPDV